MFDLFIEIKGEEIMNNFKKQKLKYKGVI